MEFNEKRLYWHSRRGMLELDLILMPFVQNEFPSLADADKQRYVDLLDCEDADLFAWFMGHKQPRDPELQSIVATVLAHHHAD